jgi:hypothetical protein
MVVVVHCRVVVPETRPPSRDDDDDDTTTTIGRSDPRWGTMGDVCRIRGDAIAVCVCA